MHLLRNRVRIGSSRSSKVDDFGMNRKCVCGFLLVRHCPSLHRFLLAENFSYTFLIRHPSSTNYVHRAHCCTVVMLLWSHVSTTQLMWCLNSIQDRHSVSPTQCNSATSCCRNSEVNDCCVTDGADVLYNKFNVSSSSPPDNPPEHRTSDYNCVVATTGQWRVSRCDEQHRVVCQSDHDTPSGIIIAFLLQVITSWLYPLI